MKNFLTDEERDSLKKLHKKQKGKRICDRIKAVLLRDKVRTWMQISHILLLSEEMLRKHPADYHSSKKHKSENGGSKENFFFEQSQKLIEHLQSHTYLYTKDIAAYVKSVFCVIYSVSGMCYWLKRNNFSYKKSSLVPGKTNKEIQEAWIAEYFKLKQSLNEDETICFVDGVHPTHNTQSYGWIKKGVRKEIPSNTGRQRLNISGAVNLLEGKLHFQEDVMLNAEDTISFLAKVEKAYPTKKKIHMFFDNAKYYKNKTLRYYLKGSKIPHFLPPYNLKFN